MTREISSGRKTAYYVGTGIATFGLLLFLSVFVTTALNFGNFEARARSFALRGVPGRIMMIAGQAIRAVGARGLSGSGVVLNSERARQDLRPYTTASGGMIRDALDGADLDLGQRQSAPAPAIMIRCVECKKLNEETDKFCSEWC